VGRTVRLLAALLGLAGIVGIARARRQTRMLPAPAAPIPDVGEDPAAELRRKLAESRRPSPVAAVAPGNPPESLPLADPTGESGVAVPTREPRLSIEERRARIHARAQTAIAAMTETGE
jgi:hypothetical protein